MDWLLLLFQFAVSGAAAGVALFLANVLLDRHRGPSLSIDKEHSVEPVKINLTLYRLDVEGFPQELSEYNIQYIVSRVTVTNRGRSAAENCKGVLKIKERQEKICWSVPTEVYKMTINADSEEYLDVCAILDGDTKDVFTQLNSHIESKFGSGPEGSVAKARVKAIYKKHEDILRIIAPTENGWQLVHLNRRIDPGPATILVTAKNARPTLKQEITILDKSEDGDRIIKLK